MTGGTGHEFRNKKYTKYNLLAYMVTLGFDIGSHGPGGLVAKHGRIPLRGELARLRRELTQNLPIIRSAKQSPNGLCLRIVINHWRVVCRALPNLFPMHQNKQNIRKSKKS